MEGMVAPNPMTADDLKVRITLKKIHQVGLGGLERSLGNNCGMSSWILLRKKYWASFTSQFLGNLVECVR